MTVIYSSPSVPQLTLLLTCVDVEYQRELRLAREAAYDDHAEYHLERAALIVDAVASLGSDVWVAWCAIHDQVPPK